MKEVPLHEWAKRLLEDQIERLGELRNANPRDHSFKLWRQTTLTVIQRLWPGNLPKSEQFRRIAFSTPSARATRNQVRQHYERGCGEAVGYLRTLMMEIDAGALTRPTDTAALGAAISGLSPPVAPEASSEAFRDTRGLDEGLVGSGPLSEGSPEVVPTGPPLKFTSPAFGNDPEFRTPMSGQAAGNIPAFIGNASPAPNPATPEPPAQAPQVPDTPQATPKPSAKPAPLVVKAQAPLPPPPPPRPAAPAPPPPVRPVASPPPPAAPAAPSPVAPSAELLGGESRGPRRTDRRQLKEMLGFVDGPATPARGPSPEPTSPASGASGPGWFEPPDQAADDSFVEPATDPFEHGETEPDESRADPGPFRASDLLGSSPVFARSARPSMPASKAPAPASENAVSAVLNALAADVTRLGVPEGQRAATRAGLIGLGRQFDLGTANWSSVRQTIVMVLEYPALARLLIPALVPYLNLE